MSKATRLFRLMDVLRGRRTPVTAAHLERHLSVSIRTVYRDVQALIDLGARIEGSAGVGYVLRAGFFLPPLMFEEEEIEAFVLGARWVSSQGDPGLARAAESVLAKICAACPKDLRDKMSETGLWAPRFKRAAEHAPSLVVIREAIRRERKLKILYRDATEIATERVIWPIALGFFEETRVAAAWCELRSDFRHFRIDRIAGLESTGVQYPRPRRELTKLWRAELKPYASK
jgi:predicted DNA-binding transcriptional regulator YafY